MEKIIYYSVLVLRALSRLVRVFGLFKNIRQKLRRK